MEDLLWDEYWPPILFAVIFVGIACFEWVMALRQMPPQPWLFTCLAVAASLYAEWKVVRLRARIRCMALGRDGERIAAEELDKLRATGAVGHDSIAPGQQNDQPRGPCQQRRWIAPRHNHEPILAFPHDSRPTRQSRRPTI